MRKIDINCDIGESFGIYQLGFDEEIMNYITRANIACGFHAGDPNVMRRTVELAIEKGVAIGAHPGFQDLLGFGRREIAISPEEVYNIVVYQIGALQAFVRAARGKMEHVKPHGALYNIAAVNKQMADKIAEAIRDVDPSLVLVGLANSVLIESGKTLGLKVAQEVFADRTYQRNGMLTPRQDKHALITDEEKAIAQVIKMVETGVVDSTDGIQVAIQADTICVHGDQPDALRFAQKLRQAFDER